jgi:hypothetical protein
MANYSSLKSTVTNAVKQNGSNAITGALLQSVLISMINSLGAQFQFKGIATTGMNPGTPDYNVAYLAGPGTYTNFGGKIIADGSIGILKYNGSWAVETLSIGSGGSSVVWNQITASGTKIAEITINGVTTEVFAPSGGGGSDHFETVNNAASLKSAYTAGITAPQGNITAPAGVIFGLAAGKVTVGPSGADFTTISAALNYLSKFSRIFANGGNQIILELQQDFVAEEQINIDAIDLSFIKITRNGYTPPALNRSNRNNFMNNQMFPDAVTMNIPDGAVFMKLTNGAKGPRISCYFEGADNGNEMTMLWLTGNSSIIIDSFCGFRYFTTGALIRGGSKLYAHGAIFADCSDYVCISCRDSLVDLQEGMISRRFDEYESLVECAACGTVYAESLFVRSLTEAHFQAFSLGRIVATSLLKVGSIDINAETNGGEISVGCTNTTISCSIQNGGIIRVYDGIVDGVTPNVLSANGVVFN